MQNIKITLKTQKEALSEIFQEITRQTGFRFSYNPQIIDDNALVSVDIAETNLKEALAIVLPNSIVVKQIENHLILSLLEKQENTITSPHTEFVKTIHLQKNQNISTAQNLKSENNTLIHNSHSVLLEKKSSSNNGLHNLDCLDSVKLKLEEEMKRQIAALLLGATITTTQIEAQEISQTETNVTTHQIENSGAPVQNKKAAQFSFVYPLGTDWIYAMNNKYNLSFNVLGGFTGSVQGMELSTIFNINKYNAKGIQFAGVFNMTGVSSYKKSSNVAQFAAGFNFVKKGKAAQFAGGANIADSGCFQAAAGANAAKLSGAQVAGGINITDDGCFQASAGINMAGTSAAQITGSVNVTKKGKFQAAAGVNVAEESQCQLAGAVNVIKRGGFQMGVVNVRDTADGVSLGILNIVAHGGVMEAGVEGGEFIHAAVTLRSGTQRLYSILLFGGNFSEECITPGFGLGTEFRFTKWLGLNIELVYYNLINIHHGPFFLDISADYWEYSGLAHFRPVFNFKIAKHFKIFAGPAFNLLIEDGPNGNYIDNRESAYYRYKFIQKTPRPLFDEYISHESLRLRGWIGFTAGVKF
ncbi:MAG: hypothetical protein LBH92_04150 [Bacteroidales bacterium]|nr:hypothetical protein [Bacteroidales bacterium]